MDLPKQTTFETFFSFLNSIWRVKLTSKRTSNLSQLHRKVSDLNNGSSIAKTSPWNATLTVHALLLFST